MIDSTILSQALAAATIVKVVVDIARLAADLPRWVPPLLALVLGPVVVVLLMLAAAAALTTQTGAQAVLAGIIAAGVAVGVTELGQRAHAEVQLRRAARARPARA